MGTASLVIGILLVVIGFATIGQTFFGFYFTAEQFMGYLLLNSIFGIPLIIIGGLFLRKYDSDKRKEKEGIVKQPQNILKSAIFRGTIIGIITVLVLWGFLFSFTYHSYVMVNDAMEPTIKKWDLIRYAQSPIEDIKVNDIVVYRDSFDQNKIWVHKVTLVKNFPNIVLEVKSEASPQLHLVNQEQYIGKITSIESGTGKITQILNPPIIIVTVIVAFVIPIVVMKLQTKEKKKEI